MDPEKEVTRAGQYFWFQLDNQDDTQRDGELAALKDAKMIETGGGFVGWLEIFANRGPI